MVLKADPFNPDNQFIRGEFYEALVRVSLVKWPQLEAHIGLEKLIVDNLLPHAMDKTASDVRERLLDDEVQKVYATFSQPLYKAFALYAKADKRDTKDGGTQTINLKEYELLLNEYALVDKDLSRRTALSAFALSQEEQPEESLSGTAESLYEMVYAEFLEVVARLAEGKYQDESVNLAQKLNNLLQYMFPSKKEDKERKEKAKADEVKRVKQELENQDKDDKRRATASAKAAREQRIADQKAADEAKLNSRGGSRGNLRSPAAVKRPLSGSAQGQRAETPKKPGTSGSNRSATSPPGTAGSKS
jgi:hypothetical protein